MVKDIRQKVRLIDLIDEANPPIEFKSHRELCDYFGRTESWLSKRIERGQLEYRGYRIDLCREDS